MNKHFHLIVILVFFFRSALPGQVIFDPAGSSHMNSPDSVVYTGSALVECFLTQDRWHSFCIPVNQTITRPFHDIQVLAKWYDEPDHMYRSIVNPAGDSILNRVMLGYLVFSNSSLTANSTLRITGALNTGTIGFNLTNHIGPSGPDGWNLIGNPYPSAINWLSPNFSLTSVDPTIYVFHAEAGNYFYWNRHDQVHTTGASPILAPQQGFYMHANVTGSQDGSVILNNAVRLHSLQQFYRSDTLMNEQLILTAYGNGYYDESRIRFDSTTSLLFEPDHDAYKLFGADEAPQLYYILDDSSKVAFNARPWGNAGSLIPLGFHIGTESTDTLVASNLDSFQAGTEIWLQDKKINSWVNLVQNPVYIFTSFPADATNRFVLLFSNPYSGIASTHPGNIQVYSYDASIFVFDRGEEKVQGKIYIYDLVGKLVYQNNLENSALNRFEPGVCEGYYIVKVISPEHTRIKKVFLR